MKYWIVSDTHFGHDKIKAYCGRPDDFEERLLNNISRLNHDDVLVHLGDICWHNHAEWHNKLMNASCCVRWLVRGNHDKKSYSWYLDHGWDFAGERITLDMFGKTIALTHRPIADDGYDLNIHGHFHNAIHRELEPELLAIKNDKQILVKMEHDYMPINLRSIAEKGGDANDNP